MQGRPHKIAREHGWKSKREAIKLLNRSEYMISQLRVDLPPAPHRIGNSEYYDDNWIENAKACIKQVEGDFTSLPRGGTKAITLTPEQERQVDVIVSKIRETVKSLLADKPHHTGSTDNTENN